MHQDCGTLRKTVLLGTDHQWKNTRLISGSFQSGTVPVLVQTMEADSTRDGVHQDCTVH